MTNFSIYSWVLALAGLSLVGCKSGGVGDPCVPEDEYVAKFSAFSADEVNVESRSFQCETRLCLVNHFEGRVSCPSGQEKDGTNCKIPGSSENIEVAVRPQLVNRQPDKAVYCSCRCAGPDPNARYCECPAGYSCSRLVEDLGIGSQQLAGSYCVKEGTAFDPTVPKGATCKEEPDKCAKAK